jgi:hypothetical protein
MKNAERDGVNLQSSESWIRTDDIVPGPCAGLWLLVVVLTSFLVG